MCRISCWSARDGGGAVVNVKPAARLAVPKVAEALAWPGRCSPPGAGATRSGPGADPVLLANVRFLAGYRHAGQGDPAR